MIEEFDLDGDGESECYCVLCCDVSLMCGCVVNQEEFLAIMTADF